MPEVGLIQQVAWKCVADGRGGNSQQQDIVVKQDKRWYVGERSNEDHGGGRYPVLEVCGS
jgi:hypothetical protein